MSASRLLDDRALFGTGGQGHDDQERGAGYNVLDRRRRSDRDKSIEDDRDDKLADDNRQYRNAIFSESEPEERPH